MFTYCGTESDFFNKRPKYIIINTFRKFSSMKTVVSDFAALGAGPGGFVLPSVYPHSDLFLSTVKVSNSTFGSLEFSTVKV